MKPMQGKSGGRPPVDPSSANAMPDDTGHDNAARGSNGGRRTRPPASVRTKERIDHEADLARGLAPSWTGTLPHSAPSIAARETNTINDEWLTSQVLKLRSGLAAGAMDQIENAMRALGDAGLRFDRDPLASHPAGIDFRQTAAIRAMQAHKRHDVAAQLTMRLIELGCDPNACDGMDNTVLMYAAKFGMADLVACLLVDCPELALHKLNFYGRNAAMIAQANGNTDVLGQLTEAGVMLVFMSVSWEDRKSVV